MMSWVVAPRCTQRAVSSPTRADEGTHERLGGRADLPSLLQESLPLVRIRLARRRDRRRGLGRDDAGDGTCRRKGPLCVEHRLQPRTPRDCRPQLVGDEEGRERRHTAKNVVWPGP